MRHGKKINHVGRKTAHRKSMLAKMAWSLIENRDPYGEFWRGWPYHPDKGRISIGILRDL